MKPLEELIQRWLDNELSSDEFRELNQHLQQPGARARLQREFEFEMELSEAVQAVKSESSSVAAFQSIQDEPNSSGGGRRLLSILNFWRLAFSAAAVCLMWWWWAAAPAPIASLEAVTEAVRIQHNGEWKGNLKGRVELSSGDTIENLGPSNVIVVYANEPTRLWLSPSGSMTLSRNRQGTRIELRQGTLAGTVGYQPNGYPMVLLTPHGEWRTEAAELALEASVRSTRLEVKRGFVAFLNRDGDGTVMVQAGHLAMVDADSKWVVSPLIQEPWQSQDVGEVGLAGTARLEGNQYIVQGTGRGTRVGDNSFHYVFQRLCGNGEITTRVVKLDAAQGTASAGLMIRESLKEPSSQMSLMVHSSGSLSFERRPKLGNNVDRVTSESMPCWIRLARHDDFLTGFKSIDGTNWVQIGSQFLPMSRDVYMGLAVTSSDPAHLATATFNPVSARSQPPILH